MFTASVAAGPGAVVFRVPGVGLFATAADPALRGATLTAGGGVLIDGTALTHLAPGGATAVQTTGAVRVVIS